MFDKYREFIQRYIPMNILQWGIVRSRLSVRRYIKGDIIHHMGDICSQLMYINSGLARAYTIDENGRDYTWAIYFNDHNSSMTNLFVVDYASFLSQTPSQLCIDVIEDCEVVVTDYKDVQYIYDHTKNGDRFGRLMSDEAYKYMHNQAIQRQTKTATQRFEKFATDTPYLLQKVPQYHIATLLGITPQHLSRLKSEYKAKQDDK